VFELDTVAKSTANATESAILQHQQTLADTAWTIAPQHSTTA